MTEKRITVKVRRFDPSVDAEPYYQSYQVPLLPGMTAMNALDYIYQNLDGTLAYYDHAGCSLGICARCTGKIDGRTGLFCQTAISQDICVEPAFTARVVKDLVIERRRRDRD